MKQIDKFYSNEIPSDEMNILIGGKQPSDAESLGDKVGYVVGALVGSAICAAKCVVTWWAESEIGKRF